jgi:hypothetical protein
MNHRSLALAGTLQLVFLATCVPAPEEHGPAIGVILNYTGATEASGFNEERALLLAARLVAEARAGDPPFRFVFRDAKDNPEDAGRAATELVEEGVVAVIGPSTDRLVPAVAEVLDAANVVLLSPIPTIGHGGTDAQPWFRMSPGNLAGSTAPALIGEHMATEFLSRGSRRALIVSDDDIYDVEVTTGFREAIVRGGGEVQVLSANDAPATVVASALNQGDADAVAVALSILPAARLVNDVSSATRSGVTWLLTPRLKSDVFLLNVPRGTLEGAFGLSLRIPDRITGCDDPTPEEECFVRVFREAWHEEPLENAYFMYDTAALLLIAIDQVWRANGGVIDSALLRATLLEDAERGGVIVDWNDFRTMVDISRRGGDMQFVGLTGPIVFTPSGLRRGGQTALFEVHDHAFVDVID